MTAVGIAIIVIISVLLGFLYVAGVVRGAMNRRIGDTEWHLDAIEEELEESHSKLSNNSIKQGEGFTESSF